MSENNLAARLMHNPTHLKITHALGTPQPAAIGHAAVSEVP